MRLGWILAATSLYALLLVAAPTSFAVELPTDTTTATVFIALYNREGHFTGWGSGFYVDEGIVITNKHVIEGGTYYRIFATEADKTVDLGCYKDLCRSDVKVNLEDDIAYIRVYLPCSHGIVTFADRDPPVGAPVSVIGYPNRGSVSESLMLSTTTGSVTGASSGPWLKTDAYIHFGNSGGPVVVHDAVVGVAVAKGVDSDGNFVTGLFVPVSVVIRGLEYANDSTFGYTPRVRQSASASVSSGRPEDPFSPQRPGTIATNSACVQSLGNGAEATGFGGCRCKASYHRSDDGQECLPGAASSSVSSKRTVHSFSSSARSRSLRSAHFQRSSSAKMGSDRNAAQKRRDIRRWQRVR